MIYPTDDDIGRPVVYRSRGGDKVEVGLLHSIIPEHCFVFYTGAGSPQATLRENLEWVPHGPGELGGDGQSTIEQRARSLAAKAFAASTVPPDRHQAFIELWWFAFVRLIDEEVTCP